MIPRPAQQVDVDWFANWPEAVIAVGANQEVRAVSLVGEGILSQSGHIMIGRHVHDLLCVHSREFFHDKNDCPLSRQMLAGRQSSVISTYWQGGNGSNVSVDYKITPTPHFGEITHLLSYEINSGRLHNQEELQRLSAYVDHSPEPIAEFDAEGQLLFGNPSLQEKMLELGFSEQGSPRLFPPDVVGICKRCVENGTSLDNLEIAVGDRWFSWHFHPIEAGEGNSVLAYVYDISARKLAEEEAKQQRASARRDFYAKMIHELRSPLNAITGFSELLMRRCEDLLDTRSFQQLRTINISGHQLNDIISDTLDVSKIEAGKMDLNPESFQLATLLDSFKKQMEGMAELKGLSYSTYCPEELQIFTDRLKVRQILVNLVSNAIKYTQSGRVQVEAGSDVGGGIVVEVRDTGVGIQEDQLNKLFGSYQRIIENKNKDIQGTGLGLALVHELINMLQGEIQVESKPDLGSTFRIRLPLKINV